VLARIVQEREINKTKLGSVVITCAAVDDITAWCILAAVIAVVKAGSITSSVYVILLALVYVLVMIKLVRPFLQKMGQRESIDKPLVAVFLLTLIASCLVTEVIGIHALFGAFMVGAIMPENERFRNIFIEKIEDVAVVLLLPLFFVFSGLRTEIGLLTEPHLWQVTALIIAVAIAGKFVGSALAAKFVGQNWKDSLTIGALMNTRGLMELVALNIGYDLGLLSPSVFTMMVIMALVTTFMTGPALDIINKIFKTTETESAEAISQVSKYKVLLSFTTAEGGRSLVRLANSIVKKMNGNASLTAMHLAAEEKLNNYSSSVYEAESFIPASDEAKKLNQKIVTLFKVSNDTAANTASVAEKGDYDLLLIDAEPSIFEGDTLGKVLGFTTGFISPDRLLNKVNGKEKLFENSFFDENTRLIIEQSKIPVGVFLDKNLTKVGSVFIPVLDAADGFLIAYAQKLISNSATQITVMDVEGQIKNTTAIKEAIRLIEQNAPNHIRVLSTAKNDLALAQQHDLCIISLSGWKKLLETKAGWLVNIPSVLIIADK
jgi:hypothetical protein